MDLTITRSSASPPWMIEDAGRIVGQVSLADAPGRRFAVDAFGPALAQFAGVAYLSLPDLIAALVASGAKVGVAGEPFVRSRAG